MKDDHPKRSDRYTSMMQHPAIIALAVAIFGIAAMLIVDHGPWSRPKVQTADIAMYRTTGEAARAAGASVRQTSPKSAIEPERTGPQTSPAVNPVIPEQERYGVLRP